jgi:hypothetical protein
MLPPVLPWHVAGSASGHVRSGHLARRARARHRDDEVASDKVRLWIIIASAVAVGVVIGGIVLFVIAGQTPTDESDAVTQERLVELAIEYASFTPCPEEICRQVRYIEQDQPPVGYWGRRALQGHRR